MPSRVETVNEVKYDPFGTVTETLDLGARGKFSFKELTVEENDNCREAATTKTKDGVETFNGRTMMRMMIIASAVEPKITQKDLANLPQRVYAQIVDFVNNLNDGASLDKDDEQDPKAS